jgi:hypothetical protein
LRLLLFAVLLPAVVLTACLDCSSGTYADTGISTWNVTMVGDNLSGTGNYANWSDDMKVT